MEENGGGNLFELFCGMIEAFNPCMDDYLYVFDVQTTSQRRSIASP